MGIRSIGRWLFIRSRTRATRCAPGRSPSTHFPRTRHQAQCNGVTHGWKRVCGISAMPISKVMTGRVLAIRFYFSVFLAFMVPVGQAHPATASADLVVYGATASGVVTAYTAAKQGYKVVLLEPGSHVGGMVTGGLSATDVNYFPIIGGYARECYRQAAAQYDMHTLAHHDDWLSEPHVGEAIFQRW